MTTICFDPPLKDAKPGPKISDSVMDMFSLKGKVAVITGSGTGIGYQVARGYAEAGADLAMWYRSTKDTIQKAEELSKEFGIKAKAYHCDVSSSEEVTSTMKQVHEDLGRIDVVVANAGMPCSGPVSDITDEQWRKFNGVNYDSVFFAARAVGPIFKKQGSGSFIATSSMSGRIVNVPATQAVYNGTKAAVTHFVKSLAFDWKDFARCNIVSPGFVDTDMGAGESAVNTALNMAVMGRQADPREFKGIYLYLASDASTYATGSEFIIDGGYTLP